ncbi:MAG: PglZ domain-containing protein [Anaerolineaceae bacterium]|nr:PglZ domain-containing protein [Anaerolineaceae bacterium]
MGIITDTLVQQIAEQVQAHRVVVWFDPEKAYLSVVNNLEISETAVYRYLPEKGFLFLRRELEPIWSSLDEKPQLLIYVPSSQEDTHHALEEYTVVGVALAPGLQPIEHNTRLAVVARRAMVKVLPRASVEAVIADVEQGKLDLAELEEIAANGLVIQTGALGVIFGTGNAEDMALRFLTDGQIDHDLAAKNAGPALADLLGNTYGACLGDRDDLAKLRSVLAHHLLLVDFLESLQGEIPAKLKTIPVPEGKAAREAIIRTTHTWRQRRDLADSYRNFAQNAQSGLGLGNLSFSISSLSQSETFEQLESVLQALIESALVDKPSPEWLALVRQRAKCFWPTLIPEHRLHWQIVLEAGEILVFAREILQTLKSNLSAAADLEHYTAGVSPWCNLDTLLRHLERDWTHFELDQPAHDSLMKLVALAEQRYSDVVQEQAQHFIRGFEAAGFTFPGILQQSKIYVECVDPAAKKGKTAYFWVDAFRYEMAQELAAQLSSEWKQQLTPALATVPTITEVGMAALLPGADQGVTLISAGNGKLGAMIKGVPFKTRVDRVKYFENKGTGPVVVTVLNEIAPLKEKHLRTRLLEANLVLVTATEEIDGLWENQSHMARSLQDHVFEQLRRGIRSLFGLGYRQIIITADHGFLAGESLVLGEPVDPPGGETADLHRRVWVGKGGAAIQGFLRKPISAFGLGGDLELVTSYGLACFKVGGSSTEYFHGGLSLQEMVIPVLSLTAGAETLEMGKSPFRWEIGLGSKKISTRFFSVTVKGTAEDLFAQPPRLQVELRADDQPISEPVAASYGFHEATRDVAMQMDLESANSLAPNTITLRINKIPKVNKVNLLILDEIGLTLHEEKGIPIEIAF